MTVASFGDVITLPRGDHLSRTNAVKAWEYCIARAKLDGRAIYIPDGRWDLTGFTVTNVDPGDKINVFSHGDAVLFADQDITDTSALFTMTGGRLRLGGLRFENIGRPVSIDFDSFTGQIEELHVEDVEADTVNALISTRATNGAPQGGIRRVHLEKIDVDNCTNGVLLFGGNVEHVYASEVAASNGIERAIYLGNAVESLWGSVQADNLTAKNFTGTAGSGDVAGVQVLATIVELDQIVVRDIGSDDLGATVEGIYTKGVESTITSATAYDAGGRQGSITMKGGETSYARLADSFVTFDKPAAANEYHGVSFEANVAESIGNTVRGVPAGTSSGITFKRGACRVQISHSDKILDSDTNRGIVCGSNGNNPYDEVRVEISDPLIDDLRGTNAQAIAVGSNSATTLKASVHDPSISNLAGASSIGVYIDGDTAGAIDFADISGGTYNSMGRAAQFASGITDNAHVGGRTLRNVTTATSGAANVTNLQTTPDTVL